MGRATWSNTWRFVAGLAGCMLLGWFAFVRGQPVPVLSLVDLGVHELGHLLTYVFPDLITAVAGSAFQVLVPVGLAVAFWLAMKDRMAAGLCLAWAGSSAQHAAVYIADAPFQRLPLLGGHHDWAFILGRTGMLDRADELATATRVLGVLLLVAGMAACLWGLAIANRQEPAPASLEPAAAESPGAPGGLPRRPPTATIAGVMRPKRMAALAVGMLLLLALSSCAAGSNPGVGTAEDAPGFWMGLWHGIILPVTFVISLFTDTVSMYEVANDGNWYDFGFFLGVLLFLGGGGSQAGRRR